MSFEIIDNIFQILVMFTTMCMAVVNAFRSRRKEFLMLAGGYGCFMMGTLYYVLCLIITGKVPQIFYVAEISWEAAYLFFLSVSLSRRKLLGRNPGIFTIIITVLTAGSIAGFKIMGPSPLFFVAFAVIQAVIVFRAAEGLREKGKYRCLDGMMFVIVWLQITVYIVSVFIRDYTRFNLYFGVDITLTLMLAGMLPALRKEVGRE